MKFVFSADILDARQPDAEYQIEAEAAQAIGADFVLIDSEALMRENNPQKAVRRIQALRETELGVYRGWMVTPSQYTALYDTLLDKGIRLINDPAAYLFCHYLPASYAMIEPYTANSVWLKVSDDIAIDAIMELLKPFGSRPLIVKDYVKSQKHYWHEACFIPSASDRSKVEKVVRRFLELQGETLNEGLVFREFIEFEPLATHRKSGMPLTKEFRLFVLDGKPLYVSEYWEEGDYQDLLPPLEAFQPIMGTILSRFFTMDIAKQKDGEWMIVELGDGQVAGLPPNTDVSTFYTALGANI